MEQQDVFGHLQQAPPDVILGVAQAFKASADPKKINLGIGAYRDDDGKPYVFTSVREVEKQLINDKLDKEYLPIEGLASFIEGAQKLIFGEENPLLKEKKVATVQTLSGTGALRVGFEFLKLHKPGSGKVYMSNPTWANHITIAKKAGFEVIEHPYWDEKTKGFDFEGMAKCLEQAPQESIILLHACAHNPTGVDPTPDQWQVIGDIIKEKRHFAFMDSAYQGFASGDLQKDAVAIKIFQEKGIQFCLAQSFAKNFGLYGERIGALHFICKSQDVADKLMSQIKLVIRPMYSNPPLHGALIVSKVLNNASYKQMWMTELKMVADRINSMRTLLRSELEKCGAKGTWNHITDQIGMFSYTGLGVKECEALTNQFAIFLVKNGRISMAGVNTKNVKYLAESIKKVQEL